MTTNENIFQCHVKKDHTVSCQRGTYCVMSKRTILCHVKKDHTTSCQKGPYCVITKMTILCHN